MRRHIDAVGVDMRQHPRRGKCFGTVSGDVEGSTVSCSAPPSVTEVFTNAKGDTFKTEACSAHSSGLSNVGPYSPVRKTLDGGHQARDQRWPKGPGRPV